MQREGERFFVRERRGWFSAMFPCQPAFSRVSFGTDKVRMLLATCKVDDAVFSITFGRFKVPAGAVVPSVEQIYDLAIRGLDGWASRSPAGAKQKLEETTLAGRSARYLSYRGADGGGNGNTATHLWLLWAEEQQAIYQIMVVGESGLAEGQRLARSMLVPSP